MAKHNCAYIRIVVGQKDPDGQIAWSDEGYHGNIPLADLARWAIDAGHLAPMRLNASKLVW
jgi:hypothetical protein